MRVLILMLSLMMASCATLRSGTLIPLEFSDQAPRLLMEMTCQNKKALYQGIATCEEKLIIKSQVNVKVPPLQGRVVYSDGESKKTEDFNWYPTQGFFIWKKKPIKDTWVDLDVRALTSQYGDKPIAIEVAGVQKDVGVIPTQGVFYHRLCDDVNVRCSELVVKYPCLNQMKVINAGEIGSCVRMVGSPQEFQIQLSGVGYKAQAGAKLYVAASRFALAKVVDISADDISKGFIPFEVENIMKGPTLIQFRLVWLENGQKKTKEARAIVYGTSPSWTPTDQPHWLQKDGSVDFVKPVLSDLLEVVSFDQAGNAIRRRFTIEPLLKEVDLKGAVKNCAYAWTRDTMDLELICVDSQLREMKEVQ